MSPHKPTSARTPSPPGSEAATAPGDSAPDAAKLAESLRRLVNHWIRVADKLERWAPGAAEAYREAARELAEEMERQEARSHAWAALRADLVRAATDAGAQDDPSD